MKINLKLLPFKSLYFFIYAAMAALMPYMTLYYKNLDLTGFQIGILAAIPPLLTFVSAPFFGFLADITQRPKLLLSISVISVSLGIVFITLLENYWGLIISVAFFAFFFAPILPIVDRSVLRILGDNKDQYGKQRLWGALGWGIVAPLSGFLVDEFGLLFTFYMSAVLFLFLLLFIRFIPSDTTLVKSSFWYGLKKFLGNWPAFLFFVITLTGGVGLALVHHYLFVFMDQLGASSLLMGWALTFATLSELGVMYFSDRLLRWFGAKGLLVISIGMLGLRLIAMGLIVSPGWVLLTQLLHGPTFASLWMAGVAYVSEIAPPGLETTSQGLLTGTVLGLGSTGGALLGGFLYESTSFSQMYLWAGLGIWAILIAFTTANKLILGKSVVTS